MRIPVFIFISIFAFGQVLFSAHTKFEKKPKLIEIKAIPKDMHTKITFPAELRKVTSAVVFDVTYNGFSTQAQAAFQYALDIWATLIPEILIHDKVHVKQQRQNQIALPVYFHLFRNTSYQSYC